MQWNTLQIFLHLNFLIIVCYSNFQNWAYCNIKTNKMFNLAWCHFHSVLKFATCSINLSLVVSPCNERTFYVSTCCRQWWLVNNNFFSCPGFPNVRFVFLSPNKQNWVRVKIVYSSPWKPLLFVVCSLNIWLLKKYPQQLEQFWSLRLN